MSYNYKLIISYDGTDYSGWQVQPNGVSIQALIQQALQTIIKEPAGVVGSGRTDAGVHAFGQVAHFTCAHKLDPVRVLHSLNGILPKDIRVRSLEEVPISFHARYSAIGKVYHYHLWLEHVASPFVSRYRWHPPTKIDKQLLVKAAQQFVGTHDFTSFANEAHRGSAARDAVRTLQRLDVFKQDGGVRLEFQADGFLYKMVRNLVGTLVAIAAGKLPIDVIPALIAAKDRRMAGPAAAPQGLFLMEVHYDITDNVAEHPN